MTSHFHPANIAGKRDARAFDPDYAPPRRADVGDGVDPKTYDRESRRLQLHQLGHRDCRWPVNDPERGGVMLFCGAVADFERSYCTHHGRRAVGAGTEGERTAHRSLQQAAGKAISERAV